MNSLSERLLRWHRARGTALRLGHKPRRHMTTPAASSTTTADTKPATPHKEHHHFRFHLPHVHLTSAFGNDWFALKAEAFARFFGTPVFLVAETVVEAARTPLKIFGL